MASGGDDPYLLVAAIDFGTTFSGYAFSFKSTEEHRDLHEKIRTNKSWGAELGFQVINSYMILSLFIKYHVTMHMCLPLKIVDCSKQKGGTHRNNNESLTLF